MEQRMGLLPNHKAGPFQSVAVEVVGPIEYQGKWAGKGWGVVFVCTTTSAVHIEFVATCSSTDSFSMALRRFMCFKGTPSRFQSDRSEQLVAAAKQASLSDFKEVIQWAGKKGIEWFVPPVGLNGQTEKMIELIKRQIWRSFEGRKYSTMRQLPSSWKPPKRSTAGHRAATHGPGRSNPSWGRPRGSNTCCGSPKRSSLGQSCSRSCSAPREQPVARLHQEEQPVKELPQERQLVMRLPQGEQLVTRLPQGEQPVMGLPQEEQLVVRLPQERQPAARLPQGEEPAMELPQER